MRASGMVKKRPVREEIITFSVWNLAGILLLREEGCEVLGLLCGGRRFELNRGSKWECVWEHCRC